MKEQFLGVDVSSYSYEELKQNIIADIEQRRQSFIVAINPEKILQAQEDPNLKNLLNKATYQIPDGVGVLLASKMNRGDISSRVTGIDMLLALCEQASAHDKSVFLYGAKPGVAEKAKDGLLKRYPNLKVAGVLDGYEKDQEHVIQTINEAKPDVLFVALGSPKQEYWIVDHMKDLDVRIFQGVGGSFDVISGRVKRAPRFFQKFGIEWLYRLITEPWRLKRQIKLPTFLYKVWKERK
ncbi:N-acetylglucosaminyldiphosphoundecaprenol N-acetyl-beta-D-mannosaminyltransferase [Halobacillus alkaliphilus]|uniref:N-acetylglucosaminyldiphosphoundecaprenol N-acetyl-beta-D-mannosaminyltransferase n=1 Tax=Halobacillus alkaliphilus TaxID=396056 RepID=A0A1I2NQU4_9BACI|nr:WecB/TagA/CpsF family glycosyltransferase [Halobacillus alkaliphilus]SFG03816.1 N-acetylglucosaminyldiphosphoundecaprenol N-acetyl-beta-D-mannosaminyltransferase [Halobacillus alkaliphilus]